MEFARHIELSPHDKVDFESDSLLRKMTVQIVEMYDKAFYDAVIEFAQREGITDLYLIDREFVKTALLREAEIRNANGKCCIHCGSKLEKRGAE